METESTGRMINLGCGGRYHPEWVNADIAPRDPRVQPCDLSRPLPFPDGSFEVVYHSNVLEHIRREHVGAFLGECFRILKAGGILRVAVPDLEAICRLYLERLNRAVEGDASAAAEYDWMMLELLDQTVREQSGGAMVAHLRQNPLPGEQFILGRIGEEGREILESLRREAQSAGPPRHRWWRIHGSTIRRGFVRLLLGRNWAAAAELGRFRQGGEVHQWMYDRFSLARLLRAHGFVSVASMTPGTSRIPGWDRFHLEVGADGTVHKPDSFVQEALKPS